MAKLKKSQLTMGSFHYAFYPFEFFCDSMKRLGIDSVEVSANRGHLWTAGDGVERAAEMRRQLEAAGVSRVACVCAEQNGFPYNIAAKDDARRAASVAYMSDTIRCAAALGSPIVLLCPGTGYLNENPAEGRARSLDSAKQLVEVAEECGVRLALETQALEESTHMNNVWQQRGFIDDVNSPWLGGMIDTVQLAMFDKSIEEDIDVLGDKLWHVHLGDTTLFELDLADPSIAAMWTPGHSSYGHVNIGGGELPLAEELVALGDAGYEGAVSVEICGWDFFLEPERFARQALEVIGDCFE